MKCQFECGKKLICGHRLSKIVVLIMFKLCIFQHLRFLSLIVAQYHAIEAAHLAVSRV